MFYVERWAAVVLYVVVFWNLYALYVVDYPFFSTQKKLTMYSH